MDATTKVRDRAKGPWMALPKSPFVRSLGDVGLAVLVVAANVVAIGVASEPLSRRPDVLAYLLGGALGAIVLLRRRWPLATLLVSAVLLLGYYSLNYPGIPPALALSVALYTAVAAGYLWWGVPISTFFVSAGLYVVVVRKHETPLLMLAEMAQQAVLLVVLVLLGEVVRTRHRYRQEVRERLQHEAAAREREAAHRMAEERLRIAHDLHDVLAHTVTAMSVQAGLALDAFDDAPDQARAALSAIRTASREAMSEIRATVGVLRTGGDNTSLRAPMPTLGQLDALVSEVEDTGLRVQMRVTGMRAVPPAVDFTGYRIIQEALTNVVRHAHATRATVTVCYEPRVVTIEICDDGTGTDVAPERRGLGLLGMHERAAAVGGWVKTGAEPDGGFRVQAWLPAVPSEEAAT